MLDYSGGTSYIENHPMSQTAQFKKHRQPGLEILDNGMILRITWPHRVRSRFHAVWLRDNGQDDKTRDSGNGQKRITLLDIPENTRIESAAINRTGWNWPSTLINGTHSSMRTGCMRIDMTG